MYDYKKMLRWVVCKSPKFDFEVDPFMVVWLHGENHIVSGTSTEEMIVKAMELEQYLDYQEDIEDQQWEYEQQQVKQAETGLIALSSCYCNILSITCSYCKSKDE